MLGDDVCRNQECKHNCLYGQFWGLFFFLQTGFVSPCCGAGDDLAARKARSRGLPFSPNLFRFLYIFFAADLSGAILGD